MLPNVCTRCGCHLDCPFIKCPFWCLSASFAKQYMVLVIWNITAHQWQHLLILRDIIITRYKITREGGRGWRSLPALTDLHGWTNRFVTTSGKGAWLCSYVWSWSTMLSTTARLHVLQLLQKHFRADAKWNWALTQLFCTDAGQKCDYVYL